MTKYNFSSLVSEYDSIPSMRNETVVSRLLGEMLLPWFQTKELKATYQSFARANEFVEDQTGLPAIPIRSIYPINGKDPADHGILGLFSLHPRTELPEFGVQIEYLLDPIYLQNIAVHEIVHGYIQTYNPLVSQRLEVRRDGVRATAETNVPQAISALFHSETVASYAGFRVAGPTPWPGNGSLQTAKLLLTNLQDTMSQSTLELWQTHACGDMARIFGHYLACGPERSLRDFILEDPEITWNLFSDEAHKAAE